jgi:phosphoribosylformylglycinamidine synthase I
MKIGVVVFPGSNCDHDAYHVAKHVLGQEACFIWHKEADLGDVDAVVLPGGFSYGDYLRTGAIAKFSPVMRAVTAFAQKGGPVLGICNGFQILQESGLLPGAMLRNQGTKFLSRPVTIRVEQADTVATAGVPVGTRMTMPIAHGEGNFYAPDDVLDELERQRRIVFRYVTSDASSGDGNPNGSARGIAGVCNEGRNVVGLMPHPERAAEPQLGSTDGRAILEALVRSVVAA